MKNELDLAPSSKNLLKISVLVLLLAARPEQDSSRPRAERGLYWRPAADSLLVAARMAPNSFGNRRAALSQRFRGKIQSAPKFK